MPGLAVERVVLIRYRSDDGEYVGSGLRVRDRYVLTAAHCTQGEDHRLQFEGGESSYPASVYVRSEDPEVDLAVLLVDASAPAVEGLSAAQVDRTRALRLSGVQALGFPRWRRGDCGERVLAQVDGEIPTAEGLRAGPGGPDLLELKGSGAAISDHPTQLGLLTDSSPWGGMSGAGVVVADLVVGVLRSHNVAAGGMSLTVTPLSAIAALPEPQASRFREALGLPDHTLWRMLPDPSFGRERRVAGLRPSLATGFVNRDEMAQLQRAVARGRTVSVCALAGMRGVGKSQLASALAQDCENAGWSFVGWVTASTREQAQLDFIAIANECGIATPEDSPAEAVRKLRSWLNNAAGDRLLVFDNVEDADDLTDLMPRGPGMRVVITTTSRAKTLGDPVQVGAFTRDQAVAYLVAKTGLPDVSAAAQVAEDLGRLPVALTQAATAMTLLGLDYEQYRSLLVERALDEVTYRESGEPYPLKVGAALRVAYTAVLDRCSDTSSADLSRTILWAVCLLAEAGVPRRWLHALAADQLVGAQAVGELIRHSILEESADRTMVSVHRLQAKVIREDLEPTQRKVATQAAIGVLTSVDMDALVGYTKSRQLVTQVASQLVAIHGQPHSHVLREDPAFLRLVGTVCYHANRLEDPYTTIALSGYVADGERVLGADHPNTLTSRNNLASAYRSAGDLGRAIPLYEQTLDDRVRVLGADHPNTLTSRNNLAYAYQCLASGIVSHFGV